ncbi:MAG: zinc ribbon domain-containing protein [Selenomonadaceae bacterium]|nr:zinc ribbon domain-containing protein [Selenomonadaceae bacterium]
MKACPKCGKQYDDSRGFCGNCGVALKATVSTAKNSCAKCGAPLKNGQAFCSECGTPVSKGANLPQKVSQPATLNPVASAAPVNNPAVVQGGSPKSNYVVTRTPKNMGLGIALALIFGPFGLFYASIPGGIIMLVIGILLNIVGMMVFVVGVFFTLIVTDVICAAWAYFAIDKYNRDLMEGRL